MEVYHEYDSRPTDRQNLFEKEGKFVFDAGFVRQNIIRVE